MNAALMEKSAEVDKLFASWPEGDAPGAAVVIIQDGQVLHKKGYGLANLKTKAAVGAQTVFRLASITKQFTATAIMMLAERGRLSYDDTLAGLLPEFSASARKITIRHLLTHTSGLPDYEKLFLQSGKINEDYPRASKPNEQDFEPTSRDVLDLLAQQPLLFAPGDEWEYGNSGYVVLAQLVERISGQSFSQFLNEHIFLPLGMNSSFLYDWTQAEAPHQATSYALEEDGYQAIEYTPLNRIYGQDGIYSTVDDMIKWCRSLDTSQLVKASSQEEAFTSGGLNVGAGTGYGFGWFIGNTLGLQRVAHTGSWAGYRNLLAYYPQEHFIALVLTNFAEFDDVARSAFANKLAKIYLSDRLNLPSTTKIEAGALKQYVGDYTLDTGQSLTISLEKDALEVQPPGLFPVRLVPESDVKFFVADAEDDSYFFRKDEEGRVQSLRRHLSLFGFSRDAYNTACKDL
jgi:CubicO group peptidase (beta-lactamase class C family)